MKSIHHQLLSPRPSPLLSLQLLTVMGLMAIPAAAQANDFPTVDRVEFVLECMNAHPGKQAYLYKCACALDHIASAVGYDEYVEIATASRHQEIGGQRGAEFRDPVNVKAMAAKYRTLYQQARAACDVP